jgi:branched-chain amino acid aminotransferase
VITVSIDGSIVPADQASISVFDRGLLYGDGCFEVLRTWDGVAVELAAHLDRLYATAAWLQLQIFDRTKLEEAVYRTIAAAKTHVPPIEPQSQPEHRIRILVTRGPGGLAQPFADLGRGRAIVIVEPLPPPPTELSLAIVDWPISASGSHKTLAFLDPLIARELARAAGADEAVRLDAAGHVVEASTCNLFLVSRGAVATPRLVAGVLPGIVRARVLSLCAAEQISATERELSVTDLNEADEVFVTSSLRGVVSVTRIDNAPRASGPITATLTRSYSRSMRPVSSLPVI